MFRALQRLSNFTLKRDAAEARRPLAPRYALEKMDIILPEYIYKYLPLNIEFSEKVQVNDVEKRPKNGFDALEDILVRNRIFYSKAKFFNDPFEFDGVILKMSENDKNRNSAYDLLHRLGIISFSRQNNIILMWSHYAQDHSGVCLRFRCIDDSFYSENGAGRVVEVEYDNNIVEKNILSDYTSTLHKMSRKACCWSYEKEIRIFKVPSSVKADDAYGNHFFNSKIVDAVYLGLKTGEEEIQKIKKIIKSANRNIELYQAIKNKDQLKIDFEKL